MVLFRGSILSKGRLSNFAKFWKKVLAQVLLTNVNQYIVFSWLPSLLWSQGLEPLNVISEIEEYYAEVRYERIAILNALGAYYSYLGKIETNLKEKDNHFALATQYYNRASRVDMHESSTWVGKGSCLMILFNSFL